MGHESAKMMQDDMAKTRSSLDHKFSALEAKVADTVSKSSEMVHSTLSSAQAAIHDSMIDAQHIVTDTLHDTLDLTNSTRRNPIAMVGGATLVGFLTGLVVFRKSTTVVAPAGAYQPTGAMPTASTRPTPEWLNNIFSRVGAELTKVGETALQSASANVRQAVQQKIPEVLHTDDQRATSTTRR